jgi:hypothetical protein
MSKIESAVVSTFVGLACPLSFFILGWWISAAIAMYQVIPITESGVAAAAITGFCVGIFVDVIFLEKWIVTFYTIDLKFIVPLYLFWSMPALALFMGLPFGNLVLGTLGGFYVGRKRHHALASEEVFAKAARSASILTGLVTSAEEVPIGVLGLKEQLVADSIRTITGLEESSIAGPIGIGLVVIACAILFVVQFWCTRIAARFAFGTRGKAVKGSAAD